MISLLILTITMDQQQEENKVNNIATIAETFLGKTKEEVGIKKSVEWCAEFVSIVLEKSAIKGNKPCSISCNEIIAQMRNSEFWYEPQSEPERNDIIFFDWNRQADGGKPLDHVGIITKYENGYVTYIDGNSADGKKVLIHTIPISALRFSGQYQDYYMRYREIETSESNKIDTAMLLKSIDKIMLEIDIMRKILRG